ncbi:hypothetical protein ABH955_001407 [Bacillus sp. RC240]
MLQPHELYATQGFLSGGYYFSKMKGDNFGCFTIKKYEKRQRVTLTLLLVHRIHKNYTFVQVDNLQ